MKKLLFVIGALVLTCSVSACGGQKSENQVSGNSSTESITSSQNTGESNDNTEETSATQPEPVSESATEQTSIEEENNRMNIEIVVGDKTFSATLYDNETAMALKQQLPLTLNMSELNGNEKYYYLSDALPTNSGRPSGIKTGDLMLYGNNCLVLFYDSFSTSYSYTPIGYVDNTDGLAAALGSGDVQVTFQIQ